jgi:hypothetical protein
MAVQCGFLDGVAAFETDQDAVFGIVLQQRSGVGVVSIHDRHDALSSSCFGSREEVIQVKWTPEG